MKTLKRKIARLFGLALRSDLKKVNEAYEESEKLRDHYLADIMTLTDSRTHYSKKEQLVSLYNFQRQLNHFLWQGDTMGYLKGVKNTWTND